MTNPLVNPKNWTKSKTWVVPLAVTVKVDDPTKYDTQMKTQIERIINELRGVAKHFDKTGSQLTLEGGEPIRNVDDKQLDDLMSVGLKSQLGASDVKTILEKLENLEKFIQQNGK